MYQGNHERNREISAMLGEVIDLLKERQNVASKHVARVDHMGDNQFQGQRYQDNRTFYGTNLTLSDFRFVENQQFRSVPQSYPVQSPHLYRDDARYGWDEAYTQVPEDSVQYDVLGMKMQQALDNQQRMIEKLQSENRAWDVSKTAMNVAEETNHEEKLTEVWSEYEEEVEFDDSSFVSIDTVVCVDRHMPKLLESDENLAKLESEISSESVSVDTVLCVDRHEPSSPESDVLESPDASEPPQEPLERVLELPDPDPDLKPPDFQPLEPLPDSEPPEHHKTEVVEVLQEEASTSSSCHKRKHPDTPLQPTRKRIRAYIGATDVIHPIAENLVDPGDTYAVYSNGPRPPPLAQWYVLFELSSSLAGGSSYPPSAHPEPAYLPDPEESDVVYHLGPRPP